MALVLSNKKLLPGQNRGVVWRWQTRPEVFPLSGGDNCDVGAVSRYI